MMARTLERAELTEFDAAAEARDTHRWSKADSMPACLFRSVQNCHTGSDGAAPYL